MKKKAISKMITVTLAGAMVLSMTACGGGDKGGNAGGGKRILT